VIEPKVLVELIRVSARKAKACANAVPKEFNPVQHDMVRISSYMRHKEFVRNLYSTIGIHNNHKS